MGNPQTSSPRLGRAAYGEGRQQDDVGARRGAAPARIRPAPAEIACDVRARKVSASKAKRRLDVVAALAAILVLAPLLLLVSLAIVAEDGGPILFRQRRTGLNGRVFSICKFRSMSVADDSGGEVRQAVRDDHRTTRVGRLIRKLSIDELPQLLNVLKGDMSIVGPRPHAVAHDTSWGQIVPFYAERFAARPGLTGYAQICGLRGEVQQPDQIFDRISADIYYIDTWSLSLDVHILLRTMPLLFNDPCAY